MIWKVYFKSSDLKVMFNLRQKKTIFLVRTLLLIFNNKSSLKNIKLTNFYLHGENWSG